MVEYEQIRKVLLIEFCGECALNTCEGCLVSDTFIRMSRRPTPLAPDAANGDGIACPICGEKSYCIHRDN